MTFERSDQHEVNARLDEAAEWLVRLESAEATDADFLAFEKWVVLAGAREAFERAHTVLRLVESNRSLIGQAMTASDADREVEIVRAAAGARIRRRFLLGGIGMGALAAAAVGGTMLLRRASWTTYVTAKGETSHVTLADSSLIRMNSDTYLRVRLGLAAREVVLERGEAAFDVVPDKARPFTVAAGEREVRVLGTEFNMLYALDRTAVAVRRGVVEVGDRARRSPPQRLAVGDELTFAGARAYRRSAAAERAFAWQSGRLIYEDARLVQLAADLNRYYAEPVLVEGAAADLRFSGVLMLDGLDNVLRRIKAYMPLDAVRTQEAIVLRLRASGASP